MSFCGEVAKLVTENKALRARCAELEAERDKLKSEIESGFWGRMAARLLKERDAAKAEAERWKSNADSIWMAGEENRKQSNAEILKLRAEVVAEDKAHSQTMSDRDEHEERLNRIFSALGMDEAESKWSSANDPAAIAIEKAEQLVADLDSARAREARAVEEARKARAWEARTARLYKRAIKALRYMQQYQAEKGTGTALSILVAMENIDDVLQLADKEIGRQVDGSLAWLDQQRREAAAEALAKVANLIRQTTPEPPDRTFFERGRFEGRHDAIEQIESEAAALRAGKGVQ